MSAPDTGGVAEVVRHDDLLIPVGSETVAAIRYEPLDGSNEHPALLMYGPYHKDDLITFGGYDPLVRYLAAYGYEVVVADMVGTGASSGLIEEMFPYREATEAVALVEWLAKQEWSTGRVGMFGKSYGGITALYAAAERPEALDAIVPILTPYTGYRNGYLSGGLFELFGIGGDWLPLMQALDVKPPSRRDVDGRWADVWRERLETVRERRPWLFQFRDHESKDEYWADKDIDVGRIETPTFAVGGWRDGYTIETVEFFEAIDAPKHLLFGPWRHTMPHRGRESAIDFRPRIVEWFDCYLKDEEFRTTSWPNVAYWTERDGGGEKGAGVWRGRDEWPTVGTSEEEVSLVLAPNRLMPPGEFEDGSVEAECVYDATVGMNSADDLVGVADARPMDTHDDDVRSLTFDTDPLDRAMELTGSGSATIRFRPTTSDPTIVVRVVDVDPQGVGRLVTRGHLRTSYRNGPTEPVDLTPGEEYEVEVPFKPKSHVFEAGHRIRVSISGAYFPLALSTPGDGPYTVRSDPESPSTVRFPGREHESVAFDNTIEMGDPDRSIPVTAPAIGNESGSWIVERDRLAGTATVTSSVGYDVELPHAEGMRFEQVIEATVGAEDPTSTVLTSHTALLISYPTEEVAVEATTRITCETVQMRTTVTADDHVAFDETWTD